MESPPVQSPGRHDNNMDVRLEPIAHSPTHRESSSTAVKSFGLEPIKDEPEQPRESVLMHLVNLIIAHHYV